MVGRNERWDQGAEPIGSCTIITTEANEMMQDLHDRMAVILPPDNYDEWLDPQQDMDVLTKQLQPYVPEQMMALPVSKIVNNPRNDVPDCLEPVDVP